MALVVVSSTVFTHERHWQELTVAELFGLQAQLTPDVPALVTFDATLTYRHLDERANRLAHVLQQQGVGPEVVVALAFERGTEALDYYLALLAIWKVGGAFLTLDLTAPAEHLRQVVAEGQARLLLTTARRAEALPELYLPTRCLETLQSELLAAPPTAPISRATPNTLAYVIFTSGVVKHSEGFSTNSGFGTEHC